MLNNRRKLATGVGVAVAAGVVAAGVAYVIFLRPQWRRAVLEIGRHLLNVADDMCHHNRLEAQVADRLHSGDTTNAQMAEAFREALGE